MQRPVFIIGLHRSGSTLWARIIQKNDAILVLREMHFLYPWRRDFRYFHRVHLEHAASNNNIRQAFDLFFKENAATGLRGSFWQTLKRNPAFRDLSDIYSARYLTSGRGIADAFKIIVEEYAKFRGYHRFCVKFPVYPTYVDQLMKWYPHCKIIHIARDPRAIYISKNNDPSGIVRKKQRSPLQQMILRKGMLFYVSFQYYLTSRIHEKFKHHPNYHLFLYEDLLLEPEPTIRRLCRAADVSFRDGMAYPSEGQPSSITGRTSMGFDVEAGKRWRGVISQSDRVLLKKMTGNSMRRFGYNPDAHPIFATSLEPSAGSVSFVPDRRS